MEEYRDDISSYKHLHIKGSVYLLLLGFLLFVPILVIESFFGVLWKLVVITLISGIILIFILLRLISALFWYKFIVNEKYIICPIAMTSMRTLKIFGNIKVNSSELKRILRGSTHRHIPSRGGKIKETCYYLYLENDEHIRIFESDMDSGERFFQVLKKMAQKKDIPFLNEKSLKRIV